MKYREDFENIEELPTYFVGVGEVDGFRFRLLQKDDLYLYEVKSPNSVHYELFREHIVPKCIDFNNRIYSEREGKVVYPKSKDFGVWAWTTYSMKRAKEIFDGK